MAPQPPRRVSKGTKPSQTSTTTVTITRRKRKWSKGWDPEIAESILNCLRSGATARDARHLHGVSYDWVKNRREKLPDFAKAWDAAVEEGNDAIRDEIKRRAMDGVRQAVYHDGKVVGHRKMYSDDLLKFLAKSRMKEFSDNVQVDHNFKFDGAAEQLAAKFAQIFALPTGAEVPLIPQRRGSDDT